MRQPKQRELKKPVPATNPVCGGAVGQDQTVWHLSLFVLSQIRCHPFIPLMRLYTDVPLCVREGELAQVDSAPQTLEGWVLLGHSLPALG